MPVADARPIGRIVLPADPEPAEAYAAWETAFFVRSYELGFRPPLLPSPNPLACLLLKPGAEVIDYPCMLDLPAPRLRAYARETVIAEKFQAMVALGRANSRMKDFYDIWLLSQSFPFDDDRQARAIAATFERRETEIPVSPHTAMQRGAS